ncbi:hypothetical protein OG895_41930 [Streptomyces sp. NBC_00201]|uniref:hypothetical protein n=1 Tax=unclassified Streptomyces TaxID=2593676 RepID=UPI00225B886A|nr:MULTISPECIES: hypothetical protein [unclassified Streptomyces]MCX5063493.1 hypothetical protein [Streptomyces sp. NBC_00452]MCX5251647.1 hypothetical protein [Streptomyces sp. NBC_00201]MCX5294428.1 hypothetical protein [Streptomyces sp. NBC_00183]
MDGSLGCPTTDSDPDKDCVGLQPDHEIRVVVIDAPNGPLVAWTSIDLTQAQDPEPAVTQFEGMLRTPRFR